jgi:hypothetical protein
MTILDWSFASDFLDDERRRLRHHVINYHYDVGGYNFVYVSFYITDTDRYSGAHVMMKRSHNRKPLRMLLVECFSARRPQAKLVCVSNLELRTKSPSRALREPACSGYIMLSRATPPTHGDRLMLAVRFIN